MTTPSLLAAIMASARLHGDESDPDQALGDLEEALRVTLEAFARVASPKDLASLADAIREDVYDREVFDRALRNTRAT